MTNAEARMTKGWSGYVTPNEAPHRLKTGDVLPRDTVEAAKWYRKGAEAGWAEAQYALGVCYADGEGVKEDKAEAAKWFRKAITGGYKEAEGALRRIEGAAPTTSAPVP
jgi:TPR repeat protein